MATNTSINGTEYFRITRTIDGKKKQFYGSSKGDAEKQYRAYIEDLADQKRKSEEIMHTATLSDRADEFIENSLRVSSRYASGTKARYEGVYRKHVSGTPFSRLVASDVRASDIQKFYNGLSCSAQTLRQIHKFISAFWKWMVLNEYVNDILRAVELPAKEDNSLHDGIVVWEDDEIALILDYLDGVQRLLSRHRQDFLVKVLLYTGMRIGEATALKYADIYDGMFHVERQIYMGELKPPKWNSIREIPIHDYLIAELDKHKKWHKQDMRKNKYKTDFIFTTSTGTLYTRENIRRALNRIYDKCGVPHKHIHAYRSTFCTTMGKNNVPLEVTSKLMGHKSLEVTSRFYSLVQPETKTDAINTLSYRKKF